MRHVDAPYKLDCTKDGGDASPGSARYPVTRGVSFVRSTPVRYNDPTGHCIGPLLAICLLAIEAAPAVMEVVTYAVTAYVITDQLTKELPTVNGEQVQIGIIVPPGAGLLPELPDNPINPSNSINAQIPGSESTKSFTPLEPYEVGMSNDLYNRSTVGDNLAIHHAPQGNPAAQVIPGYDYRKAPAIVIPAEEHIGMNPANIQGSYSGTPRDLMAKTLWDLKLFTEAPNSALWKLLYLVDQEYPGVLQK